MSNTQEPRGPVPGQGGVAFQDYATTTSSSGVSRKTRTPETLARELEVRARQDETVEAQQRLRDAEAERERVEAEHRERIAQEQEAAAAEREREEKEIEKRIADKQARFEAATDEAAQKAKVSDYWDDMSDGRRFLAAILIGASEAVGGNAKAIYDDAAARYRARQENEHKAALEKAAGAGASRDELIKLRADMRERSSMREAARDKAMAARLEALKAKHPQAAARADAGIADLREKQANRARDMAAEYGETENLGQSRSTVIGNKGASDSGTKAPGATETLSRALFEQNARASAEIKERSKSYNPAAMREFIAAARAQDELENSGAPKAAVGLGRFAGALPQNVMDGLTPEARQIAADVAYLQNRRIAELAAFNEPGEGTTRAEAKESRIGYRSPSETLKWMHEQADKAIDLGAKMKAPPGAGVTVTTEDKTPREQSRVDAAASAAAEVGRRMTAGPEKKSAADIRADYKKAVKIAKSPLLQKMTPEGRELFFKDFPALRPKGKK